MRRELAPWERQIAEAQSQKDVAAAERDLLLKQQLEAQERLEVSFCKLDILHTYRLRLAYYISRHECLLQVCHWCVCKATDWQQQ